MTARLGRAQEGQSSVELVALLPVLVALAVGVGQILAAGLAREASGNAAQAGAMALLQGPGEAEAAAREALPRWARRRARIAVRGRRVVVRVEPVGLVPGMRRRLAAERSGDAGPEPSASAGWHGP